MEYDAVSFKPLGEFMTVNSVGTFLNRRQSVDEKFVLF